MLKMETRQNVKGEVKLNDGDEDGSVTFLYFLGDNHEAVW